MHCDVFNCPLVRGKHYRVLCIMLLWVLIAVVTCRQEFYKKNKGKYEDATKVMHCDVFKKGL